MVEGLPKLRKSRLTPAQRHERARVKGAARRVEAALAMGPDAVEAVVDHDDHTECDGVIPDSYLEGRTYNIVGDASEGEDG